MKIFTAILTCVLVLMGSASAAADDSWLAMPPPIPAGTKKERIPVADIFEVVTSMLGNAQVDLHKKPFVAISEQQAQKFTGRYYSCPKGKRPYLIRAVFGFAGTGSFHVYKMGRALCVSHESLGDEFVSSRSALIVNLAFEPTAAYTIVDIAR